MRKVGVLSIALAGLLTLGSAAFTLSVAIAYLDTAVTGSSAWPLVVAMLLVIPVVLLAAVGRWLIVHRERLAEQWFEDGVPPDVALGATALTGALLGLAGIWLSVNGVGGLFVTAADAVRYLQQSQAPFGASPEAEVIRQVLHIQKLSARMVLQAFALQAPGFTSDLVRLGLGLIVLLRRTSIAGWLTRCR